VGGRRNSRKPAKTIPNLIGREKRKMRMRKKRRGSLVLTKTLDLSHRRRGWRHINE
jgi:hypothetical protein